MWTGSEMIVWGGYDGSYLEHRREIQSAVHEQLDSHQHHQRARWPILHTAVWTGSEMIVWGGYNGSFLNTGGRYNPEHGQLDSYQHRPTRPTADTSHRSVDWQRNDRLGRRQAAKLLNTGGRYNPSTDSWTATSTTGAPTARTAHTAVWTGSRDDRLGRINGFGNVFEHRRQIQSRQPTVGQPPVPPTCPTAEMSTRRCGTAMS